MMTEQMASMISIVYRTSKNQVEIKADDKDVPLRQLGLTSVMILNCLIAFEDEFAFEWPENTPREVFRTLSSIQAEMNKILEHA